MLKLTDVSITKAAATVGWKMEITVDTPAGEMRTTQFFDDFGGMLTAMAEAGRFFAVRLGKLKANDANRKLTRPVAANPQ